MQKWYINLSWYSKALIILSIILTISNLMLDAYATNITESMQKNAGEIFDQANQVAGDFADNFSLVDLFTSMKAGAYTCIALFVIVIFYKFGQLIGDILDSIKELVINLWKTSSTSDHWVLILSTCYDMINIGFLIKTFSDILLVTH